MLDFMIFVLLQFSRPLTFLSSLLLAHCVVDIDECESDPCENEGTCEDEVNAYTCACAPGYNGTHCKNR